MSEKKCPLCGKVCKSQLGYGSHLRMHAKKGEIVPGAPVIKGTAIRDVVPPSDIKPGDIVTVAKNGERFMVDSILKGKIGRKVNAVDPLKYYLVEELTIK